jgi:hypothetical protein
MIDEKIYLLKVIYFILIKANEDRKLIGSLQKSPFTKTISLYFSSVKTSCRPSERIYDIK